MAEAIVHGVKLSYRQVGAGTEVVLVHGLGANQAFWNIALVAELAREFRVTTFDLRGHGYSAMPPSHYRPADLAADLDGLLGHLGIGMAHLVGHSFGGRIALQFAVSRSDRVLSLTIADTRLHALQPGQVVTASEGWPSLRATLAEHGVILDEDDPELGFCLLGALASLPGDDGSRRSAVGLPYLPFGKGGTRSARRWVELLSKTSIQADYHAGDDQLAAQLVTLSMPVLAIYGDESPTRPTGERIGAALPQCETIFIPGGRHFHPATHPQFFLKSVRIFFRRVDESRDRTGVTPIGGQARPLPEEAPMA